MRRLHHRQSVRSPHRAGNRLTMREIAGEAPVKKKARIGDMLMTTGQTVSIRPITVRQATVATPCRQSCVIVRDASGSMLGQKEIDALDACRDLVEVLAAPGNGDTFRCAVVDFSGSACVVHPLCQARQLAGRLEPMDIGYTTDIAAGLRAAGSVLNSDQQPLPPGVRQLALVIALYSDGGHNESGSPEYEADCLKQKLGCTIVTITFGQDADEDLLRKLASSPSHFYRAASGTDLRKLFARVGRTMSISATTGRDPRQALGGL